jgi:hypothetical protein
MIAKDPSNEDRFDRARWKSMQMIMSDSNKYVDLLHSVSWQEGLPLEVVAGIVTAGSRYRLITERHS